MCERITWTKIIVTEPVDTILVILCFKSLDFSRTIDENFNPKLTSQCPEIVLFTVIVQLQFLISVSKFDFHSITL